MRVLWSAVAAFVGFHACLQSAGADAPEFRWIRGGHTGPVNAVAVSPTEPIVASASDDGTLKIWRLSDGRLRRTVLDPETITPSASVLFSHDGTLIAGSGTGGGAIWRVSDGATLQQLGLMETGSAIAFSPDDQLVAVSGSIDGFEEATLIFRVSDGQLLRTITRPGNFYGLASAFAPDGSSLFVARGELFDDGDDGAITQYRVSDGAVIRSLTGHAGRVGAISLAPDGATLASGGEDGTVRFWRVSDGATLGMIASAHAGEVKSVAYSPDGAALVSAGADGALRIWRTADRALLGTLTGHVGAVSSAAWTRDSRSIVSAGAGRGFGFAIDYSVRLWDASTFTQIARFTDFDLRGLAAAYAPNAGELVVPNGDEPMQILDARDGRLLHSITPPQYTYLAAISPDGSQVASGSFSATLRLWDVETQTIDATITWGAIAAPACAFSPDGQFVAVGSWDLGLRLYRAADGGFVREFASSVHQSGSIVFSPDGALMAAVGTAAATLWRVDDGSVVRTFPTQIFGTQVVALSDDAGLIAVAGSDPHVEVFRVSDGAPLRTLTASQFGHIGCLAFSPDGAMIAAGSNYFDQGLRLWTIADGIERGVIDQETGRGFNSVQFSDGGRSLLIARDDGVVASIRNPALPGCPADVNADGAVDLADLAVQLSHFGLARGVSPASGDLDDDGNVGLADLTLLLSAFGADCP